MKCPPRSWAVMLTWWYQAARSLSRCRGNDGDLVARRIPVRVYVPFGNDWFRYWMRRLAESRGA